MANPTNAYLYGLQEPNDEATHEQAIQGVTEQQREAHARNVKTAHRIMQVFNQHANVFRQYGIAYCLDEDEPPFAPTICLFKRRSGRNPEITFVPVVVGGERKTFSLRHLSKRKRREQSGFFTDYIKFYQEHYAHLSDDPKEAASEIMSRLSRKEIEFESLWRFDRTMAHCVRQYFARRPFFQQTLMAQA
jgi:hypothetical protein